MTPYQHIMQCAESGTGCRLTADEVAKLAMDNAIYHRAHVDDEMGETGLSDSELQPSHLLNEIRQSS
jgi:hypothetical protein